MRASSTVLVKASSRVKRDFPAIVYMCGGGSTQAAVEIGIRRREGRVEVGCSGGSVRWRRGTKKFAAKRLRGTRAQSGILRRKKEGRKHCACYESLLIIEIEKET